MAVWNILMLIVSEVLRRICPLVDRQITDLSYPALIILSFPLLAIPVPFIYDFDMQNILLRTIVSFPSRRVMD